MNDTSEQRNLILAIVLSIVILMGFQVLFAPDAPVEQQPKEQATEMTPPGERPAGPALPGDAPPAMTRQAALTGGRVPISTPRLHGSIALRGGRIDDLTLVEYHERPDPKSPEIELLSPAGAPRPYYAEYGWVPAGDVAVPGEDAEWSASGGNLTPERPVTLTWDNGEGLRFIRTYTIDKDYLFSVAQRVENKSGDPVTLHPYALISRTGTPETAGFYILHEGPMGVFDSKLKELDYSDLRDSRVIKQESAGGWIGITDKYWLTALVPPQDITVASRFAWRAVDTEDKYQADYMGPAMTVPAGGAVDFNSHFFAGAKKVDLMDRYADEYGIDRFDLAIDFGWFYFLTKPFFYILKFFNDLFGNFGLAILGLTVLVKLAFFPLANKSYVAMSKMKKLQPEMKKLQERFADDRVRLNQELMALYKAEKVNPVSGCLPIVVQIPVFFALYKVLFVTIEMRHAPFYGWIRDLSAPDPTSLFNLFGLLPFDPPAFLMIGAWPLIMGGTMYLQQKLNPQPTDPVQAKIFMFLPIVFTFLLASFPAGLVIYWAWSNLLSILQQWLIMRRMGVAP